MTDLELNKALHEKVMEKCNHEVLFVGNVFNKQIHECRKCGYEMKDTEHSPSYTTNPADYWGLLMKVKKHFNWHIFVNDYLIGKWRNEISASRSQEYCLFILLDMPRGCRAIWEFFGKEQP